MISVFERQNAFTVKLVMREIQQLQFHHLISLHKHRIRGNWVLQLVLVHYIYQFCTWVQRIKIHIYIYIYFSLNYCFVPFVLLIFLSPLLPKNGGDQLFRFFFREIYQIGSQWQHRIYHYQEGLHFFFFFFYATCYFIVKIFAIFKYILLILVIKIRKLRT